MSTPRYRVVVTDDRHGTYDIERDVLAAADAELIVCDFTDLAEARPELERADGVLLNLFPFDAEAIGALKRCRVVSRYGTGYDNVDVPALTEAGIWLARVPDYATEAASDHAVALLLAAARQIAERDAAVRRGAWGAVPPRAVHTLRGLTLGIAGLGRIGSAVQRKLAGFGFSRVVVYDPHKTADAIAAEGAEQLDLHAFVAAADLVSWSTPLSDETRGLVGAEVLNHVRPGAIWVNTSRGAVFDEAAVAAALADGRLGAFAADVFVREPLPTESPLRMAPNTVFTDHIAYHSEESFVELKRDAARNVASVLGGGAPLFPVNTISAS